VIPGTEGVASLDDLTQGTVEDLPPVTAMPTEPVAAEPEPAPAESAAQAETEAEPAPQEQAAPPTAEPAPPAIPPALTQQAPVRKLREMPPDYRADFPALTVEVHVFEPGRRFVMVNGRRYREGERLAEGPQIVEIVRDGIVLEYRGERVLYPLGR
jgi:general secretion pathway protein B